MSSLLPKAASSLKGRRPRSRPILVSSKPIWVTGRRAGCKRMWAVPEPLLAVSGLYAGYGAAEILRGVDFDVHGGEIVTVLGANGAGKSTMSRTISGVVRPRRGAIRFKGKSIERDRPAEIVALGLIH